MRSMSTLYVIAHPTQLAQPLFQAAALEEIARALAAQDDPRLTIYANADGLARELDTPELHELHGAFAAIRAADSPLAA